MTFDAPFGKEPEGGARGGALSDPEDLDFHSAPSGKPHRAEVHQSLERLVQLGHWQTGSPRELLERAFAVGQLDHRRHARSEEHTSELQSQSNLVCRLLLEKKKTPSC